MTDRTATDTETHDSDDQTKARKSPYNINGPRTAEPEDFDQSSDEASENTD